MEKNKKEKIELNAQVRDIVGKQVKKLRKEGNLPANIFGEGFKSTSIVMPLVEFVKVYRMAGETQVVYVQVGSEQHPTLIDTVQKHPISGDLLHVDFKKVSLKKKIETEVPIVFVGTSEAVEKKHEDMLTFKDTLWVKALPDAIPSEIEVDITSLIEVDDEITVGSLKKSADFEIVDEAETVIARISAHVEQSVEPDTTSEIPADEGTEVSEEGEQASEEAKAETDEKSEGNSDQQS